MKPITPCLWFSDEALEAATFYVSVIPRSTIRAVSHYGPGAPMPEGSVLTVSFELNGQDFMALNGGPHFQHSPAVSFVVRCDTQDELDAIWAQLSAVPEREECGWLQDKFGVSWQVVPSIIERLVADPDKAKVQRVMAVILSSKKLDIAALERAAAAA
ncbi:MAG: VOC family protein [Myxococcota bacterium]